MLTTQYLRFFLSTLKQVYAKELGCTPACIGWMLHQFPRCTRHGKAISKPCSLGLPADEQLVPDRKREETDRRREMGIQQFAS